jgi:hypothetical protein
VQVKQESCVPSTSLRGWAKDLQEEKAQQVSAVFLERGEAKG